MRSFLIKIRVYETKQNFTIAIAKMHELFREIRNQSPRLLRTRSFIPTREVEGRGRRSVNKIENESTFPLVCYTGHLPERKQSIPPIVPESAVVSSLRSRLRPARVVQGQQSCPLTQTRAFDNALGKAIWHKGVGIPFIRFSPAHLTWSVPLTLTNLVGTIVPTCRVSRMNKTSLRKFLLLLNWFVPIFFSFYSSRAIKIPFFREGVIFKLGLVFWQVTIRMTKIKCFLGLCIIIFERDEKSSSRLNGNSSIIRGKYLSISHHEYHNRR